MVFNVRGSETIYFVVGLFIGIVIAIIRARYLREQIKEHEERNQSLTKANKKKDAQLKDLSTTLQEYEEKIENLSEKINQSIANNHSLTSQVNERDQAITQLKEEVKALDGRIKTTRAHAKKVEKNKEELENSFARAATQMMDKIKRITAQVEERDRTINQLQEAVNIRDRDIHEWRTRLEEAQTKILDMETLYAEKERDIATLEARIRSMQDNLTIITGIGPKVSTVLRSAGVTTFTKLAALNAKKIEEILLAENPRLLQLVDPTTWPEQARLASAGEWEVLKSLRQP